MKYLLLSIVLVLTGCENGVIVFTDLERKQVQETQIRVGKARHDAFVECMNLASKMPRQADDDVSDIVDSCSNQSLYMTNYLK